MDDPTANDPIGLILRFAQACQAELDSWLRERIAQEESSGVEVGPPSMQHRCPSHSPPIFPEVEGLPFG
jgi:hypothetical protein